MLEFAAAVAERRSIPRNRSNQAVIDGSRYRAIAVCFFLTSQHCNWQQLDMARFSSADELVTLPRMSAADAVALGTALEAAALAHINGPPPQPLPGPIAPKFQRMVVARDALSGLMRGRIQPDDEDTPQAKAADRVLDNVWGGTRDFCTSFTRLPRNQQTIPLIESAEVLLEALFKNGLDFTGIKFRLQWVESRHRLDLIAAKSLDTHFQRLGGGIFLAELHAAQEVYGKALGLTEVVPEPDSDLRRELETFRKLLKQYVIGVNGQADPDIPGSQALADKLLAPLNAWKVASTSSSKEPSGDKPNKDEPTGGNTPTDGGSGTPGSSQPA